ncbi:protein of unknown function [Nitrospira japonica]|uniref:Uncharacterized protein n=1 Tax=Nitrospira japonica TaxID=1325564 RepID=A0A1W1I9V1_9BACT|nr:hypothetical protein [Nitrospira japonica]SLM49827.1 protein of unknown function [Nitrospira japonica]
MAIIVQGAREAITGKLLREKRLRMEKVLHLLVLSGVIRLAKVEPPLEGLVTLQPPEAPDNVISASAP